MSKHDNFQVLQYNNKSCESVAVTSLKSNFKVTIVNIRLNW